MKTSLLIAFLTAIVVGGLTLVDTVRFSIVQASTEVNGTIMSDTIWTKANSPYNLIGPMLVSKGITLTIEPGVIVNFNHYYIQINGTLVARGSNTDKIQFNDGSITFMYSTSWNEQSNTGTIIENANLNSITIEIRSSSVKINNNIINGGLIQSQIQASDEDTSLYLTHEKFETAIISNNCIVGGSHSSIIEALNTDIVSNNTLICTQNQRIGINAQYYSSVMSNIIAGVRGYGIVGGKYIAGNVVSGFEIGINAGSSTVTNNLIFNNTKGIEIGGAGCIVQNNTISYNSVGVYSAQGYFNYNNFENNSDYDIYLDNTATSDVNATYNWWGTTDTQAISQKIYDNNNNYNLGTVTFEPFLTQPNPEAPDPNTTPSSTSPSQDSKPTQDQSGNQATSEIMLYGIAIAVAIVVIVGVALVLGTKAINRTHSRNTLKSEKSQSSAQS
jgi:parallel beta-helix repeat protein